MRYNIRDPAERFWRYVDASDVGGCWLWTGAKASRGRYGAFTVRRVQISAHRFAYEQAHGPLPVGHQIDHLCRNTLCVRADHLEAVTAAENGLRSARTVAQLAKTHCPQGHQYDDANTIRTPQGHRKCRECQRIRSSARYAAHPEQWVERRERKKAAARAQGLET